MAGMASPIQKQMGEQLQGTISITDPKELMVLVPHLRNVLDGFEKAGKGEFK